MRLFDWLKDPAQGFHCDVRYAKTNAFREPARASGLFRPRLTLSLDLATFPEYVQCFVIAHELAHLRERHAWWSVATAVLCFPLLLVVRPYLEARADRAAARWLTTAQFIASASVFRRPGLVHRWLYGKTPIERARRAGYLV